MSSIARPPFAAPFVCEKQPASGARGVVVANHPLASAAGAGALLAGGNAIDAAVTALFALSVVEPMMVGPLGGGVAHLRLADGAFVVIDGLSTAPRHARPDMFAPTSDEIGRTRETTGRANEIGGLAVATPGALAAWLQALETWGTMSREDALAPAIRLAERGFVATPYLADCVADCAAGLAADPALAALFLPGGAPLRAGERLVQGALAGSLRLIARDGAAALAGGAIGQALAETVAARGGILDAQDCAAYRTRLRAPIRSAYRGYEIFGPPPPASAGVHVAEMLNILEGFDIAAMGFGSVAAAHLLAEAMKIAFADRAAATADPDFVDVPVERLIAKTYADERRAAIDPHVADAFVSPFAAPESRNTTHVTAADRAGNIVATTQTLNGLFGACLVAKDTGLLANNYMYNFEPRPGRALSIAPGKRVFTSMAPMIALKDGRPAFALGLPGALRIFPSALQAIVNLVDHAMSLQQAVEAPRLWTEGGALELEPGFTAETAATLAAMGHRVLRVNRVAGGMNAIAFGEDGMMQGAACWRADGTPVAISGGLARPGARFTTR